MLVLTRREAETVIIPGLDITIEIVQIQGKTVRIGIEAPREIKVLRGEIEVRNPKADSRRCAKTPASQQLEADYDRVALAKKNAPVRPLSAYLAKPKSDQTVREKGSAYQIRRNGMNRTDGNDPKTIACQVAG